MEYPMMKLKAAWVNAGMTQDCVVEVIHKNKQTIDNWENGVTVINARDLRKLSELYGIQWIFRNSRRRSDKETCEWIH